MDLSGRRIVLTGATGGIGRMLAPSMLGSGAKVALVARDEGRLAAMAAEVGGDIITVPADVSSEADNERVVDRVVAEWGGLDVWIANAGVSPFVKKPRTISAEEFRRVIEVNLVGAFLGARSALRALAPGGRIIMTSSVLGARPKRGFSAYSASKAGLEGLVRALAVDLAQEQITVNAVVLGWFDSPLAEPWITDEKRAAELLGHIPVKRWGNDGDLCGLFGFLAGVDSGYVTGATIPVDGGYLLP